MNNNVFLLSDDAMHPVRRKIVKWEWYTDIPTKVLFFHLMLTANFKEGKWRGMTVKRGQTITTRARLARETGLTVQQVRTSLNKLKSTSEITSDTTNQYHVITLTGYETYNNGKTKSNQRRNQRSNQRITNEQPTDNQRITTIGEEREEREERELKNMCDFEEFWNATPRRNGSRAGKPETMKLYFKQPLKDRSLLLETTLKYAALKAKDPIGIKDPVRVIKHWKSIAEEISTATAPSNGHGVDVSTAEAQKQYQKDLEEMRRKSNATDELDN